MFLSVFIKLTADKTCFSFWCFLSSRLTYKLADSWPRVSTNNTPLLLDQFLYLTSDRYWTLANNNSLWLLIQQDYMSERQLASLAPSSTKALLKWGDIFLRQTLPICEQIVLYLKTTIFTFLIGQSYIHLMFTLWLNQP